MNPYVHAMIISDHYYRDRHTGKSIISGTFSTINSRTFPSSHSNCAVYVAMSDVATDGKAQLEYRMEDGSYSMKLPEWEVKKPEDRRAIVEIGGNINGLPLPKPGVYEFVVLWNGMEISSRRLNVKKVNIEKKGGQEGNPGGGDNPEGQGDNPEQDA